MGVHDQIKTGQIDVIEWTEDASGIMLWRFPASKQEIMYGARLHVHEFQVALFLSNGQTADIFRPGIYTLTWENMPKLQILQRVAADSRESFSADIYFVKTKYFLDENWVFEKPVALRDSTYGMVRVNAFGSFDIRVIHPSKLISKIGSQDAFTTAEAGYIIGKMMQNLLPDGLRQSNISVLEEDNDYSSLAPFIQESINTELYASGLMIENLRVRTTALKPEN
jgi:membrane protease subunit (stomatin/prohibitin family)